MMRFFVFPLFKPVNFIKKDRVSIKSEIMNLSDLDKIYKSQYLIVETLNVIINKLNNIKEFNPIEIFKL